MRSRKTTVAAASALLTLGLLTATGPAPAALYTPENLAGITINDSAAASPYPASFTQWGMAGRIADVNVTLFNVNHTFPDDVDIAIQSPSGVAVMLASDACGSADLVSVNWTFDQSAGAPLSDGGTCTGGSFQPSSYDGGSDTHPTPWPATVSTALTALNDTNPNGIWRLWVRDDSGGDIGTIAGGFRVTINTAPAAIEIPLGDTGGGTASPYPQNIPISGVAGKVTDVDVTVTGLSHTFPDDIDMMILGPTGDAVMLMSDACGNQDINNFNYTWNDEAGAVMADGGSCFPVSNKPTDFEPGETLPAPAPAGPYGTSLGVFDGKNPNGTWKLFINDDASADSGYLINEPTVDLTVDPPPETTITRKPANPTTRRRAVFEFTSNEPTATFRCKLDAGLWKPCTSPREYERLDRGRHTFQVRATDELGSKDPTPATWTWRIVNP